MRENNTKSKKKIAIIHDYLVDRGGAERVVVAISRAFPSATIYTSVYDPKKTFDYFDQNSVKVVSSYWLNFLLKIVGHRERLAPLILFYFKFIYVKRKKLESYDVVISSSSAFAIDVRHKNHLCYCHTPARFIWHNTDYNPEKNVFKQLGLNFISAVFKPFDFRSSHFIKNFLTNSKNMQKRIKLCYNRSSTVLFPSIRISDFKISSKKKSYFLVVSRLKLYKQVDLAIKVFNDLGLPLYIAGSGSEEQRLRAMAGKNICFLGKVSDNELKDLYANCRAFIFPGEEDFGITPLEAQAAGRPVIGFGRGGLLETVIDGQTGLFFKEQTVASLKQAIISFIENEKKFNPQVIRTHAQKFDEAVFIKKIRAAVLKN